MWDPSRGTEAVSPVFAGGFLTAGPPGKPFIFLNDHLTWYRITGQQFLRYIPVLFWLNFCCWDVSSQPNCSLSNNVTFFVCLFFTDYFKFCQRFEGPPFPHMYLQFSSVIQSCLTHGFRHARLPCQSPTPGACSNSCPSSRWCHPTISSSVIPFSSCLLSFPVSESFPVSQFFASGNQSLGVSASTSVLPMNIQDWFPLGWTGWISLQSKGLSRVFSNTTVQKR